MQSKQVRKIMRDLAERTKQEGFVKEILYDPKTTVNNVCAFCQKQVHDETYIAHTNCTMNALTKFLIKEKYE